MVKQFPMHAAQLQSPSITSDLEKFYNQFAGLDLLVLDGDLLVKASELERLKLIKAKNPSLKIVAYFTPADYQTFGGLPNFPLVTRYKAGINPGHFMMDDQGNRIPLFYNSAGDNSFLMNQTNAVHRQHTVDTLSWLIDQAETSGVLDGVFLDWCCDISWLNTATNPQGQKRFPGNIDMNQDGVAEATLQVDTAWANAISDIARKLKQRYPGLIVMGNGGRDTTFKFTDLHGIMIEEWMESGNGAGAWGSWSRIARTVLTYRRYACVPEVDSTPFIMVSQTDKHRFGFCTAALLGVAACLNVKTNGNYKSFVNIDETCVDPNGRYSENFEHRHYLGQMVCEAYDVVTRTPLRDLIWSGDLVALEDKVYRADYLKGIVLVNPSLTPKNVALERTYRRILAKLEPNSTVNNGAAGNSVTLAAQSGIILLRT